MGADKATRWRGNGAVTWALTPTGLRTPGESGNMGNWGGDEGRDDRGPDETGEVDVGEWEGGRRTGARIKGIEGSDENRKDRGGGESNAAMGNRLRWRGRGTDRRTATSNRIGQGVARYTRVALEPMKGDCEGASTVPQEEPDSSDNVNVGGGTGTRGDLEGILTVGKDSDVAEAVYGKTLKEGLEAEADCIDLPEVVGARTQGSPEVNAQARATIRKENGRSWPWVRRGGTVGVTNHGLGIQRLQVSIVEGAGVDGGRRSLGTRT